MSYNNTTPKHTHTIRISIEPEQNGDWTIHEHKPNSPLHYTGCTADIGIAIGTWIANILDVYQDTLRITMSIDAKDDTI